MTWDIIKILLPITLTFFIGILITPTITDFLYKHKMWKKKPGKITTDGLNATIFNDLHKDKEVGTPRMGGMVIWISVMLSVALFLILSRILPETIFEKLDFLSRNQTWIPVATLLIGAFVGLIDDLMEIKGSKDQKAGGLSFRKRLVVVGLIGIAVSTWFFIKLGIDSVSIPFGGELYLGAFIIPLFTILMMVIYSGGVIDGIDGLAGGVFAIMFSAYGIIAFSLGQINLAALCAAIVGATLAFLWFNIPPARFYMSETGSMALTITLTVVAFMTDSIVGGIGISVLPIIALPLIISIASSVLQLASKKFRNGKKIFLVAPVHHHFEAIGWPAYKVTMRYWIFTLMTAFIGIMLILLN